MRADMKDVIIDTGRTGKDYDDVAKVQITGKSIDELDDLPEQEGIKKRLKGGWGAQLADRIEPLRKFLRANVGRPWDKVFSEICEHADLRSLRGKHLREHVDSEVDTWNKRQSKLQARWSRARAFYADEHGILREDTEWRRYRYKPKIDPDRCVIGDRRFERINGCWFEAWYIKEEVARQEWNYFSQTNRTVYSMVEVVDKKRQLSKNELRDLHLSNSPDFKWWEKWKQ